MRISDWSSEVCSSDLHLKSVIVPSVQSPPSMLKLHDFCNRAGKLRPCTGWNSSVGEDRMPNGMRCLDPSIADRITSLSTMRNNEEIFETFGLSYNTLSKVTIVMPLRSSLANRIEAR